MTKLHNPIHHDNIKKAGKYITHSFMRRFVTPAAVFLVIMIIISATVFYLSMKSGVPKFSLPELLDLTSDNVASIKGIYQVENNVFIKSISFSPDGQYFAVLRVDNILHIWNTKDYHLLYTFQTDSYCDNCITFSPDSRFLAAIREGRPYDVIIWDLETGKSPWESLGTLVSNTEIITGLSFSPDGNFLVGAIANKVLFWQANTTGYELVREIVGHTDQVRSLAFSPDGQRLLTTSDDMTAKVWDASTGDWLMTLNGHTNSVVKGIYSPDGKWIVTAGYDQKIMVWNSQTGNLEKTLSNQANPVISLAFSSNSQLLASATIYKQVILWDGVTWDPLLVIDENFDEIIPIAFSPDNKLFVTASLDGTLKLWGVEKK